MRALWTTSTLHRSSARRRPLGTTRKAPAVATRIGAVMAQRCPVCLEGQVFDSLLGMRETCPFCGVKFERENGYYLNAMFIAYVLGFLVLAPTTVILYLFDVSPFVFLAVIVVEMALLWPAIFRYSRILWLHLDQMIEPRKE